MKNPESIPIWNWHIYKATLFNSFQKQGIHLSVICCRSTKNDFYIERKGDIDYYHIPDTIQNNDQKLE